MRLRLSPVGSRKSGDKEHRHAREDGPPMTCRSCHPPERYRQRCRDDEDREHLKKIGEWRRVLKWMSAVRIKEAAAVCAEHFDGFLRSDRPLRNRLRLARLFKSCNGGVGLQVLHYAL